MKKVLVFVISFIMIFSAVGCMNSGDNSFPINPSDFNSGINADGDSKEAGSESEVEDIESSQSGVSNDKNSSSNNNDNNSSSESARWTGFY